MSVLSAGTMNVLFDLLLWLCQVPKEGGVQGNVINKYPALSVDSIVTDSKVKLHCMHKEQNGKR